MRTFLLTPKSHLKGFIRAEDREYFSKPVQVEILYTEIYRDRAGRYRPEHVVVRDPRRGSVYPTNPVYLRDEALLTRRQRQAAGQVTRISKSLAGKLLTFYGFDGKEYPAMVTRVARGVATIAYQVYVGGAARVVTAYIEDARRLSLNGGAQ